MVSDTVTIPIETGEFPSSFDFAPFDWTLGSPTSVQVSFTGYLQPKVTNTGLTPQSSITIQADMSVQFFGSMQAPMSFQGDPLTMPVDLAAAGAVGGQGFSGSADLPLSFLQAPGGILSGFADVLGYSSADSFLDGSTIDASAYSGLFTLNVTYDPVDEPASPLLLASGLVGLAALRKARTRVTGPRRS